jgi:excisionase family DNA binding protein
VPNARKAIAMTNSELGSEYMNVKEAAAFLGISESGAYKAIQRGKLKAFRRSPRQTLVTRHAAEAYRSYGLLGDPRPAVPERTIDDLRAEFEARMGMTARAWQDAWKRGEIEETVESFAVGVLSFAILASEAAE